MFKKTYVADMTDCEGLFSGSIIVEVWFFNSSCYAHRLIGEAKPSHLHIHNFRRVE